MNGSKLVELITKNNLTTCEFIVYSGKHNDIWMDAFDKNKKRKLHLNTNTGEYKIYGNVNEPYIPLTRFEGC